ncbi:MAG: hypothetical protein L7F78_18670 [Syntrophales bacterium LBB04]|nr:hypothetical protein [Syntrophales bacterium LBB04]
MEAHHNTLKVISRMRASVSLFRICTICISFAVAGAALAAPPQADKLTKEELLPLLCSPRVTLIDLRFGRDWYDSNVKMKCAVREDPMKPGQWMDKYPKDKMLVLYCD